MAPELSAEHSMMLHQPIVAPISSSQPAIAVCISGSCSDRQLLRRTAAAVIGQNYQGTVTLLLPDGISPSNDWLGKSADGTRRVITSPRADRSSELDCNAAFLAALQLHPAVDFVAVLNCGEVPPAQWLGSLVNAQEEFDADLVIGPVKAVFDEAPSDWMLSGAFFDRFGIARGPIPRIPAADNLLMRAEVIRSLLPRIFPKPAPDDSEWIDFAYRVEALGFTSIWANDAVVFDAVRKSRMTKEWVIDREYYKAVANTRAEALYKAKRLPEAARHVRALGLLISSLMSCGAACFDQSSLLKARLKLAQAKGLMAAGASRQLREKEVA